MRATVLQTNLTAGEISPKMYGRVDIARYQNGAKAMRDMVPQVYGGAKRRPSSLFVKEVKDSTKVTRLIPFVRNNTDAYILELGDLYMRVFKNGAVIGAPYEVATPYATAKLFQFDFTQGADTMFMFHDAVAPYKLVCAGDASWTLSAATFVATPFVEPGTYPAATLSPSISGPVGREITLGAGVMSGAAVNNTALTWNTGVVTVNKAAHGFTTGDLVVVAGVTPRGYDTVVVITVVDADNFTYPLTINPGPATIGGTTQVITPTAIFAAGDVGSSVKINGGIVKITGYTSTSVVTGIIKQELSGTTSAQADAWSLHTPAWSAANGYPRTGTLYEQRLVCGGSTAYPQTIWGSVTGAYLDFQQGTADDDGYAFTIASDVVNPIRFLASNRSLLALTTGGEFTISGGLEKPLAPTNAQIKPRTNYGCADVRPVRIKDSELFVQRAGRKVRSFAYNLGNDDWTGPDLSVLAEHLTESGIVDMCWQQEPNSIVWLAREDGSLLSITLDKEQEVTAWALHEGFGQPNAAGVITALVESLATIPDATGDQVWMVVKRTIGGATKRYIERLYDSATVDSCVMASGAAATVWSGFDHLEGETVDVVCDWTATSPGYYAGQFVVTSGDITLTTAATSIMAGLPYESRLELLDPEMQTGMGSSSGNAMRTSEVTVRFHETTGCNVNGKVLAFRRLGTAVLDQAPELFSGVKRLENLGWERGESDLEFTQTEPMPLHILSVTRKFTVNSG
jgi:hypothetical protein